MAMPPESRDGFPGYPFGAHSRQWAEKRDVIPARQTCLEQSAADYPGIQVLVRIMLYL